MKTLLTIALLLTSLFVTAQNRPLDILIVGTSHNYGKNPTENFKALIDRVAQFNPDAVYGEFLSAADYDALTDYWNKATMKKRYAYMEAIKYPAPANPAKFIQKTTKLLHDHPNFHQERMKLARALYLKHDIANARYQLYRLDKARPNFGAEEIAAYKAILGEPDSIYTVRSNEYHNIVFPLMDKLHIDQMGAMDSQRHDVAWSNAWGTADSLFRKWAAGLDSTSADGLKVEALMKRRNDLQKASNLAQKEGRTTEFYNSPDGDEFQNIDSFYGARRLFGTAGFPEAAVNEMLAQWQNRNTDMVHNVVERARKTGANRVVVFVGANHRNIMHDGLTNTPNVTAYELSSLK